MSVFSNKDTLRSSEMEFGLWEILTLNVRVHYEKKVYNTSSCCILYLQQ